MKRFKYILLAGIINFAIGCQNEDTVMVPIEDYIVEDNEINLVIDTTDIDEDEPTDTIAHNAENEDDTNTFELVSVEEFRDYYQLDNDISDEDIEGFIFDYDVTEERMGKYDMGKTLSDIISTGEDPNLGYHLSRIRSNGHKSDKKIEDFIKEANWIYIVFDLPSPQQDEFAYSENMVIDLKNSMIYFNANEENYRDAELSAKLSNEDIKNIYVEFPQNVGDYVADINPCLEYGYHIYVVDGNKNQLNYNEYTSDEKNKAFDSYWKKLYQQYFGKDKMHNSEDEGKDRI